MNDELYDVDCAACAQAQHDYAAIEQDVNELVALIKRLVRALRKAAPDDDLSGKALKYLLSKNLQGSPLRSDWIDEDRDDE